jgi:eukaryotic-like serine/threonine-protein kinase
VWGWVGVVRELQPGDPRLIGPYRLLGQLGEGGMGRVYLGLSEGGRPVAVKVIRAELAADPDFRMRFRREVAAARKVNGLYTALVVDADPGADAPWLATAYVAGPSLAEAVRSHGALPVATVLTLAAGLAEGLAAIHAAGLVHRDLKPSNVLLAEDGPRVIDFGIARAAEATSVTHTGLVIGSPGFLSPEQAQGHDVGPPSDVFSLGAVIAFAATGRPPLGEGPTAALVYRVVHDPAKLDQVPGLIRPLVERSLAKDPSQRPSARDLLAEVGAAHPVTGWLPEPISHAFSPYQVPAIPGPVQSLPAPEDTVTRDRQAATAPPDYAASTIMRQNPLQQAPSPDDQPDRPSKQRHRARRLTLAGIAAAVLAGAAITGYALSGGHPTVPRIPAAAAAVTSSGALSSAAAPSPSPHTTDPRTKRPRPSPTIQPPQSVAPAAASPAPAVTRSSASRQASAHSSTHPATPSPSPSPTSAAPLVAPVAPSNLTVSAPDANDIELNWQVNSTNQTGFEINNGVTSVDVGPGSTSYDWGGLSAGTYMCFKILAYNSAGDSDWYPNYSPWYVCTTTP